MPSARESSRSIKTTSADVAVQSPSSSGSPSETAIPALAARWKVHRAQTAELLGDAVIDSLAARLRRHLR